MSRDGKVIVLLGGERLWFEAKGNVGICMCCIPLAGGKVDGSSANCESHCGDMIFREKNG